MNLFEAHLASVNRLLSRYIHAMSYKVILNSVRRSSSIYLCRLCRTCFAYIYVCVRVSILGSQFIPLRPYAPVVLDASHVDVLVVILARRIRLLILENSR